jgi:serine/threonine-protein kinase SRPK3
LEEKEIHQPVARKQVDDNGFVYLSQHILGGIGPLLLCDLGQARAGGSEHTGIAMPMVYRAPEIILGMKWNNTVDM